MRPVLARVLTRRAQARFGDSTRLYYQDGWYADVGEYSVYLGNSDLYVYPSGPELNGLLEGAADHWFHVYKPKPGDVIVDVGAGHGWDTLAFSRAVGPTGKVLAIEASPKTFDHLNRLCQINKLDNVIPLHAAVLDQAGSVLIEDGSNDEANRVVVGQNGNNQGLLPVEGDTLDDICRKHSIGAIDFLKMNIEGAEASAIRGMAETVENTDFMCIACHDFLDDGDGSMVTTKVVREFLEANGYQVVVRDDDPREYARYHYHASRGAAEPIKS